MPYTLINNLNKKNECTCSDCSKYIGQYTIRARLLEFKCGHTFKVYFYNYKEKGFEVVIEEAKNCPETVGKSPPCDKIDGQTEPCTVDQIYKDVCQWDESVAEDIGGGTDQSDDAPICGGCHMSTEEIEQPNGEIVSASILNPTPCHLLQYEICCEGTAQEKKLLMSDDLGECPDRITCEHESIDCTPAPEPVDTTVYCGTQDLNTPGEGTTVDCDCYDYSGNYKRCEDDRKCETSEGVSVPCLDCMHDGSPVDPIRNPLTKKWECPCFDQFGQAKSSYTDCYTQQRYGNYTDHQVEITADHLDSD